MLDDYAQVDAKLTQCDCKRHAGFKDVQLLPASQERGAFAFVEFQSSKLAGAAREALDGFQLGPEKRLDVKWAKRA